MSGSPEMHERVTTLLPDQEKLRRRMTGTAGSAFTSASDYWNQILNNDPNQINQMFAPEFRKFNQQTIPDLAEQFAGMGSGGLSSSGFRNAGINAGVDLQERLGAIRAQLKNQAAQGLMGLGQTALGNYSQDVMTQQSSPGFGATIAPLVGSAAGSMFGAAGTVIGNAAGQYFTNRMNKSPYQGQGGLKRGY